MSFLLLSRLEDLLIPLKFVKQDSQIPLLEVSSLITRVQDFCLGVEIHATDREENRLSIFFTNVDRLLRLVLIKWITISNLLLLIVESLPQKHIVILEWTWNNRVEVKVAVHVS